MIKQRLIISLLIGLFVIGCSSDDDSINDNVLKHYKTELFRDGTLSYDKIIGYSSDNKIQTIILNNYYSCNRRSISIEYSENSVITIQNIEDDGCSGNPVIQIFKVNVEKNQVRLLSENSKIEINHTNGYVDSVKEFYEANSNNYSEMILTRDKNLNLISSIWNLTGSIEGNNDNKITHTYSDFDSDKKVDPSNFAIEVLAQEYLIIFDLKVTKNNPGKRIYNGLSAMTTTTYSQEYNNLGYVIKSFELNPNTNYIHNYYTKE